MLLRDVPYRSLQIVLFDELARMHKAHKNKPHLAVEELLSTGVAAGCAAAAITTPFDLVRSRLLVQAGKQNVFQTLATAIRHDGVRIFTGSMFPKVLYVGCSVSAPLYSSRGCACLSCLSMHAPGAITLPS